MNKVNFDSLKGVKAPQAWLEKAALIPEAPVKKRAFPLYRIAAAASVVLVSAIGLLIFLFFGRGGTGNPVAVRQGDMIGTEAAVGQTVAGETTQAGVPVPGETTVVLATDAQGNTVITYREKAGATENAVMPTSGAVVTKPKPPTASNRGVTPTASPGAKPSAPTKPNPAPTAAYVPTAPPEQPDDPPAPTDPPEIPVPTEGISTAESAVSFTATFDASLIEDGEPIYCIFTKEGTATGSYTTAARVRADYFITKKGLVHACCEVPVEGSGGPKPAVEEGATYLYQFVNRQGRVLASGSQAV